LNCIRIRIPRTLSSAKKPHCSVPLKIDDPVRPGNWNTVNTGTTKRMKVQAEVIGEVDYLFIPELRVKARSDRHRLGRIPQLWGFLFPDEMAVERVCLPARIRTVENRLALKREKRNDYLKLGSCLKSLWKGERI